jgi:hypothetical protein
MGTSTSFDAFGDKLERLGREVRDTRRPLNVAALEAKRTMQATAGSALNGKLTGKRRRITVGYDIGGEGMRAWALVGWRGPAHLINNPTRPHEILPRRRRGVRTRRRGASMLRFNAGDGGFAPSAHHPGTTGKHFYEKAKAVIKKQAPKTYGKVAMTEPLARVFH